MDDFAQAGHRFWFVYRMESKQKFTKIYETKTSTKLSKILSPTNSLYHSVTIRNDLIIFHFSSYIPSLSGWRLGAADERMMLKAAASTDGVLVTNENFREAASESEEYRRVVEERTLIFSYINDHFVPPDDPLGRLVNVSFPVVVVVVMLVVVVVVVIEDFFCCYMLFENKGRTEYRRDVRTNLQTTHETLSHSHE